MSTDNIEGEKPTDTDDEQTTNWDRIGHILASTYREQTLRALADQPQTPSQLAERCSEDIANISRALSDLRERDLVTLLVPEERKKGRIYGLTDEGGHAVANLPAETPTPHAGGGDA